MSPLSRWFGRRSDGQKPRASDARRVAIEHLTEFAQTRAGVEAYVEPATAEIPTTVMFVATTGEWTRRQVPSPEEATALARKLGLPVYDVRFTGYPQRVRDWNSRQRRR